MPLEDIAKAKEIVYIDVKNKKPMLFGQEVSFENYQRITNFVYDHKRAPDGSQTVAIVALTEKERVELEDVKMTKIESYVMSAIADMILKDTDMFNCVSDHSEEYDDTFVGYYTTWMTDEVVNSIEDLEVREYVRRCRVNKKLRDKSNIWRKVMSIVNFPIEQHKYLETTKKALEKKFPLLFRIHFNNEFPMSDLNFYLNAINKGV
jgi:hypothetical protein